MLLGLSVCAFLGLPLRGAANAPFVYLTTIDTDIVTPILAQWIDAMITRAEQDGAEALVIQLDTPGGLLTATHDIVKDIMTAKVPVIVYVGPSGSRAASAGTFITVAGHVAAMAPATSIGAAHVVNIDGSSPTDKRRPPADADDDDGSALRELIEALRDAFADGGDAPAEEDPAEEESTDAPAATDGEGDAAPAPAAEDEPPAAADETADEPGTGERPQQDTGTAMGDKIMNDTISWARTIATERNRNADWIERAIVESASITEDEALELNVIDLVAEDVAALLVQSDGRTVHVAGRGDVTLRTAGAEVRPVDMTLRYRFLGALAHPQIMILLATLGGLGLMMELYNPNGITGAVGAVCLILAYFGMQTLPINVAGLLLLALALVLLAAEFMVVSYGLLTLGALVCFTLGGLMLIDSPDEALRLQLSDMLPLTLGIGLVAAFLISLVVRAQRTPAMAGADGMIGAEGIVTLALDPHGKIETRGEFWNAESAVPVPEGARVRVTALNGLTVTVEPVVVPDAPAASTSNEGENV